MTDTLDRLKSVFLDRFYIFGGAATALAVFKQVRFGCRFASFTNQTLRQFNIGTVSYACNVDVIARCSYYVKICGASNKLSRDCISHKKLKPQI